ncbi:MAG: tetratricopeptide repeat protein [Bacteroidales bacterium]|nr:tetratricopeptide repeat protein [Bacteroidales bacterium]
MKKTIGLAFLGALFFVLSCTDKAAESQKSVREANVFLYNSNLDKAFELFRKAVDLNPDNQEAWYGLGMVWMNKMKYEKAIGNFDKAIELKPDYMDAFYNRGQSWFYLGENYKACDDWKIAYDLGKANMEDKLKKCN